VQLVFFAGGCDQGARLQACSSQLSFHSHTLRMPLMPLSMALLLLMPPQKLLLLPLLLTH
jgi:hypothetical protein